MTKLEVIRERVEMQQLTAEALGMAMGGQFDELAYLLTIIDAASGLSDTFEGYAATVRYNNRENRTDWEQRAVMYVTCAHELRLTLDEAEEA